MPLYEYQHTGKVGEGCTEYFEIVQKMSEDRLTRCPLCGNEVKRLLFPASIAAPHTNADLKNLGFTKLVKRDDGIYENVTKTDKEKRYMTRGDAESIPDVKSKISD